MDVMFCSGGNGELGPFKSLILLQYFQFWKKKKGNSKISFDINNESHMQSLVYLQVC